MRKYTTIIYLDETSNIIKIAKSIIFDELFSDLNKPPPNAQILRNLLWKYKFEPEKEELSPLDEACVSTSPFNMCEDVKIKVTCSNATFGLDIMNNEIRNRACMNDVCSNTSTSKHPNVSRFRKGAYVAGVNNAPVHTKLECMKAMQHAKTHNDVDTLHLKWHPIPSVSCNYVSETVPALCDY